jgi:hypothetical protein
MRELEPLSFDRTLREASELIERRTAKGEPVRAELLPAELFHEETLAWLRELKGKDPLAEALEHWLLRIREQAELGARRAELGRAHRVTLHAIGEPEQTRLPLAEMLSRALARPGERAAYLRSYFSSSASVAELVTRLWEERQQFAERNQTQLDSFEVASSALAPAAREFLSETQAAYETLAIRDAEAFIAAGLAESSHEGWPARLTPRTVTELVDRAWFEGLRVRPFALPVALGAGSFLLALGGLGRALASAASTLHSPFVLARDVFDSQQNELGALFASLPLSSAFASRTLGLGASRTRDHLRALARAHLVDARVAAFRVLLRELLLGGSGAVRRELAELSHSALGFELPAEAAGAFVRVRPRDSQRFAGSLLAANRYALLVETHEEDWFRDPRAIRQLRAELSERKLHPITTEELNAGRGAFRARLEPLL